MSSPRRSLASLGCAFVLATASADALAQSSDPIAVALMTGFIPGANPGMAILNGKLQAAFGGGGSNPPFSSQVFAYSNPAGAAAFLAAAGPNAKRVMVGHSFGAQGNFTTATNHLGPMGLHADLQISVDFVAQSSPFAATSPTVPAQILLAYNYHQTSTVFLEPVPSFNIIGAERNLNMESVFADSTLTHTSVDDDARVHELVIARVRELFQPPPFPGTDEHLDLFCRIDELNVPCVPSSGIATPGVLTSHALQLAGAGDWVTFRTLSPEGDFSGSFFGILGEIFVTGAPPAPALPGLASSLAPGTLIMITPGLIQYPPTTFDALPAAGFTPQFCWPTGLVGVSVLVQTVVIDAAASNGVFATSLGFELRGV
jgi:hypothetical protein